MEGVFVVFSLRDYLIWDIHYKSIVPLTADDAFTAVSVVNSLCRYK